MSEEMNSQALLRKALLTLADDYDLEEDSFFLVVTKDGKQPDIAVTDQMIIGELNLKTVVAFIIQSIHQLCVSFNLNPFVFISRHLVSYFIEAESRAMKHVMQMQATMGRVDAGNPEKPEPMIAFNDSMTDVEN